MRDGSAARGIAAHDGDGCMWAYKLRARTTREDMQLCVYYNQYQTHVVPRYVLSLEDPDLKVSLTRMISAFILNSIVSDAILRIGKRPMHSVGSRGASRGFIQLPISSYHVVIIIIIVLPPFTIIMILPKSPIQSMRCFMTL